MKKEIELRVEKAILAGKTKQEIFENIKSTNNLQSEELADIIQSIPSLKVRKKYKSLKTILIILLFLNVLVTIFYKIPFFKSLKISGI